MHSSSDREDLVLSETLPTLDGKTKIGRITINSPKTLNALNLEIILLMQEALHGFERDDAVKAVLIDGAGDKAFCAGGDVKSIRQRIVEMKERGESPVPLSRVFFENEYKLDLSIHTFRKPIVIWGDGIIMGGGLGIAAGASHRVVTETTMIAMPEITIGLYPDVGASYFLPRMPGLTGLFLGLTAYRMKAADACYVGLADFYMSRGKKEELLSSLRAASFGKDAHGTVTNLLKGLSAGEDPGPSLLKEKQSEIDELMQGGSVQEIYRRFEKVAADDPFLKVPRAALLKGSPTSLAITFEQYHRSKGVSLEAAFEQELNMSLQCCDRHDFSEGVRALLVDKDNAPRWEPSSIDQIAKAYVDDHFKAPLS